MDVKPYKLKHKPTGLYYQPHKYCGSNLSKRGKIYQTKINGLSYHINLQKKYPDNLSLQLFTIYTNTSTLIYKEFKNNFNWTKCGWYDGDLKAYTKLSDWIIEEI